MRKAILVSLIILAVALIAWALGRVNGPPSPASDPAMPAPSPQWCRVQGVVLDAAGAPLPGTPVRARILDTGLAFDVEAVSTDPEGRFVLTLFPPAGHWEILARSRAGSEFSAELPVLAVPGETLGIVLREPALPPAEDRPPDVAGEVLDGDGRLVTGVSVSMVDEEGVLIATTRSGEGGRFEFRLDSAPPVRVHIEGESYVAHVPRIPRVDLSLILDRREVPRAEMWIGAEPTAPDLPDRVEVEVMDSVGDRKFTIERRLSASPWYVQSVPFGVYDVVIRGPGVAGELQGFHFCESGRSVVVPVGPSASISAALSCPARALLISRSPTFRPMATEFWQDDGVRGHVRGVRARSEWNVLGFDFKDLGPGKYRLKVLGAGVRTLEQDIELAAGERMDLGTIELEPAEGVVILDVADREAGAPPGLDFGYRVTMYNRDGVRKGADLGPNEPHRARFAGLTPGPWYYRVERKLSGMGHTQHIARDRQVLVEDGVERTVKVDCTWRME